MSNAFFEIPIPINEPVKEFRDGSIEKKELLNTIQDMKKNQVDIPMIINGKEVKTSKESVWSLKSPIVLTLGIEGNSFL